MLPKTIDDYGGLKQDDRPVEDPTTDFSADDHNELITDVAGMTNTTCQAWRTAIGRAASPLTEPSSKIHNATWDNDEAVNTRPTATRTTAGIYVFTWPATVKDRKGDTQTVNFNRADASFESTSAAYILSPIVTAPNEITVYIRNPSTGALVDPVGVPITVFGY